MLSHLVIAPPVRRQPAKVRTYRRMHKPPAVGPAFVSCAPGTHRRSRVAGVQQSRPWSPRFAGTPRRGWQYNRRCYRRGHVHRRAASEIHLHVSASYAHCRAARRSRMGRKTVAHWLRGATVQRVKLHQPRQPICNANLQIQALPAPGNLARTRRASHRDQMPLHWDESWR